MKILEFVKTEKIKITVELQFIVLLDGILGCTERILSTFTVSSPNFTHKTYVKRDY